MSRDPPSSVGEGWEVWGGGSWLLRSRGFSLRFSSAQQVEKTSAVFTCLWRAVPCPVLSLRGVPRGWERRSRACRGRGGSGESPSWGSHPNHIAMSGSYSFLVMSQAL